MVLESNTLDYIFLQDGENGVGTPGKDGKTLYTWVKYSQNADGSNMSDSPENALYIGIAYNKDSATESTNANDYNWTKIKGEQGLPGTDAYTIILSNESHTFSGTVTSAIASSTKCYIIAYKGTKQLSVTIGTISNLPEGMTAPISNNGTTNAYFSPTVTSLMTTKNGTLTIPITVDGKTFTKYFSYSLALQGNNGLSATNIILSNESHTFSANASGQADSTSINIDILGFTGTTQVRTQIGELSGLPTGMTMKINNNGTINTSITVSVTSSLTTSQGTVKIPITADGVTVEKSFSYALSRTGETGAQGKGIKSVTNYYLATSSSSGVTTSTSGWTTSIQSITSSKRYLWNYEIITYTDNTTSTTTPVIIGVWGNTGSTGETGKGIKSITEYYLASSASSGVTTSTSGWSTSMQTTTTTNKYLWNYEKITYTDDTTSNSTVRIIGTHGATGTAAKSIDITASSQVFKSTDGGNTFSPDTITLTPVFQGGISYSKWQYSVNGGSTWTDVTSGSHGLTISSGVLSIAKTSDLFTDTVTSISFKCISNNSTYYDIMTVLKLYDVTDIEIGGTQILRGTNTVIELTSTAAWSDGKWRSASGGTGTRESITITDAPNANIKVGWHLSSTSGTVDIAQDSVPVTNGDTYTMSCYAKGNGNLLLRYGKSPYPTKYYTLSNVTKWKQFSFTFTIGGQSDNSTNGITNIYFGTSSNRDIQICGMKLEKGNKCTDWTPAPEDIQDQFTTVTNSIKGVANDVDQVNKKIIAKVWQNDITDSINEYDGSTVKKIRDRVASTETDISGIKTTLSDVQTTVSKKADGSTVQTLSTKFATMESNFNGFKTTVSNTYTTKEDFNNLEIGGRNLARKTSNEYCAAFNSFNGNDNICPPLARVYLKGLSVGDKVTVRLVYKYTNIVAVTGKTAAAWTQGFGNITVWTSGAFWNSTSIVLSGSGEKIIKYSFVITSDMIKNQYWDVSIRHDGIQSGSVQWKEFKVEKGNIATDWTPAPEDVEQSITNVSSQYTQLADKFNWIVKSGTSSSDFTITDRMISLTSSALNIDALTTFKNSAENGSSTVINGGAIKANTIITSKLATDAIKSTNYSYSSGNFSSAGTFLDLSTGLVRSKNFAIDSSGNVYLKGNIQANAGYIGGDTGWAITTNTITGNANSKIISGILESSNYVENSTGVQMNLNTGIIKGNIEASTLAAKEAIKIYVGSTKRNVITGRLASDFFDVTIGCDLSTSNIARVKPSIILSKSTASTNVPDMIMIDTSVLDIEANTSIVGSLSASDISTYTNAGMWISGKTSAAINILTTQSESSYHPVLRIRTYSGNVWCLGGLGDTVGIYGYYSGRTTNGYDWCTTWDTSNGNLITTNNINCNDIMTRTGWAADRLSNGQTAYSNLMGGRISFNWAQNSSGLWKIYVYVDGALVRDW